MPKKPKPKQQRRREPEALDEQEVREGTRRVEAAYLGIGGGMLASLVMRPE